MKGYYVIYECSKNQWLAEGLGWLNDRDYYPQTIGTKHAIQISQSYNYNPNLPQVEVIDTQTANVLMDGGDRINPNRIKLFDTMNEAEVFLLKTLASDNGEFYSIRKIYS
jgi:hypothetical protein